MKKENRANASLFHSSKEKKRKDTLRRLLMAMARTDLKSLSDTEFQAYGCQNASTFSYRVELACRIASHFQADHLIVFDDVALTVSRSERATGFSGVQVCFSFAI